MNLKFYIEKLSNSKEFKNFMKENKGAYLCSGFFVIDREEKNNGDKQHLDYCIQGKGEMFSFQFENGDVKVVQLQNFDKEFPREISVQDVDFTEVENIILGEMEKNNVKSKIQKIIISLQKSRGKDFLICTVFISMLGLLKVVIDLPEMKISTFEKKSIFDIVKRVK
ncbi:hypothetical protein J4407_00465 [Candidatus Pacearchaeota archaeon]|nr:hypothetical protein [Candidatus Pacearchaeota archaeon]